MKTKSRFLLLILVLVLALAPAAFGQYLTELGPISTVVENPDGTFTGGNGFPEYIGDVNGIMLDLAVVLDPVIPDNPFSVHTGFGAEGFYFLAQSSMDIGGGKALLDLGVEAAYGAEDPRNGDQFLFVRTRIRIDTPVAGLYTVLHPWGQEIFNVANVADGINFTYDWGGFGPLPECGTQTPCITGSAAPGFERILVSPKQGPFLIQAGFEENATCIGDGTPATVTGSPIIFATDGQGQPIYQNFFRVQGPTGSNLGGAGIDFIETTQFSVFGHRFGADPTVVCGAVAPPPQQQADTVTINRARLRGVQVEVRANSSNGFPMTAELWAGGIGGTLVGSGNLGNNGRGNISFTGATPDTVRVHSTSTNPNILGGAAIAPIQ